MSVLKKSLRLIGIVLFIAISLIFVTIFVSTEDLPSGKPGAKAEETATRMLGAINQSAFEELKTIRWSLNGHDFDWNKKKNQVSVSWKDKKVVLDTKTQLGNSYKEGIELSGEENEKLVEKAIKYFNNDSFWLVAPYKVRDNGVVLRYVDIPNGHGLLVTYTLGGTTPGDSYLWILDEDYFPQAWKLWVEIIPVGGFKTSWDDWQQMKGAWFPGGHSGDLGFSRKILNLEVE